jgi:acetyltransferase-like isoleucine patch superfamily enzyme
MKKRHLVAKLSPADWLRRLIKYARCQKHFGRWGVPEKYCDLMPGASIHAGRQIKFGIGVYFGPGLFMDGRGGITIGDNVIFAPEVALISYNHDFKTAEWKPYGPGIIRKPIEIGADCWFGMRTIILPGAKIGEHVIAGAGSVISGEIEPNSIIAGNPARVVRKLPEILHAKPYQIINGYKRRFG